MENIIVAFPKNVSCERHFVDHYYRGDCCDGKMTNHIYYRPDPTAVDQNAGQLRLETTWLEQNVPLDIMAQVFATLCAFNLRKIVLVNHSNGTFRVVYDNIKCEFEMNRNDFLRTEFCKDILQQHDQIKLECGLAKITIANCGKSWSVEQVESENYKLPEQFDLFKNDLQEYSAALETGYCNEILQNESQTN